VGWRAAESVLRTLLQKASANTCVEKELNMDYLACNLPTGTAKDLKDYWSEYWHGKTPEARLAQQICAFEHLIALDEDGITIGDFYQSDISSPELRRWLEFLESSKGEVKDLQNTAAFGSSYWKDADGNMRPSYWKDADGNMRLLDEVIKTKLATSPLPYIRMLRDMSTIKRRGWIKRGMDEPDVDAAHLESDASHSWAVGVIGLLFSPKVCVVLSIFLISLIRTERGHQVRYIRLDP
jgi:5'-deoxynucleotidase YfbR-like HD superfamily hydrolase